MSSTEYQSVPCLRTYGTCHRCGAQQSKWVNNPPEAYGTLLALSDTSDIYGVFELAKDGSSKAVDKLETKLLGLPRISSLVRAHGQGKVIQSLLGIVADKAPDGGCWRIGAWPHCGTCGSRSVRNAHDASGEPGCDVRAVCIAFSEWIDMSAERLAIALPDLVRLCEEDVA